MNKINIGGYSRISKAAARKEFNAGNDVYIMPVNMSPVNAWFLPYCANKFAWYTESNSFDSIVNAFEFYNCNNNEMGKYAAFYKMEAAK